MDENDVWLALRGSSIESFPFIMNPTVIIVKLCSPILICVHVNVNSSCIQSFAVDKLLAAAAPKP